MSVVKHAVSNLQNFDDEIPGPVKVDIFPTQKCNLNCKFCEFPDIEPEEYQQELSTEKILNIVDEAAELGAKTFGIIGGEPLVKDGMIKIMERIKKNGMNGSMTTNGTLLDTEKVNKIVDMEWDLLRISIDGLASTHDRLRGKDGSFNKIKNSLKKFDEMNGKTTIQINTVLNRKNYEEIPELVEFANNYNIKKIILLPIIEFNDSSKNLKINKTDVDQVIGSLKEAKVIAQKYGISINTDQVIDDELYENSNETDALITDFKVPCYVPWYSLSIDAKGIATPCSQFTEEKGLDVRGKSLKEVWTSEKFEKIRKNIISKDIPDTCSKCCAPLLEENKEIRNKLDEQDKIIKKYL